jgi:hypothetical protein
MPDKKNTFVAVEMSIADLDYFQSNDFRNFTFQQLMTDGTKNDDSYILTAYAINYDGRIMNDEQIILKELTGSPHQAGKRVQFANVIMWREDLEQIFPDHIPNTPITLTPIKSAKYPQFVSYTVQGGTGLSSIIIDPSPPAKS